MATLRITTKPFLSVRNEFSHAIAALIEMKNVKTAEQSRFLLSVADFNKPFIPGKGERANLKLIEIKNAKTAEQIRFLLDPVDFNKAAILERRQHPDLGRSLKQKLRKPRNKAVFI